MDDHSTRQQIDALGKLGLQHTRLGDKRVPYGWLAVFAALHFIDQHLGEPDYYEGEFIDHAIALGLARSTAYSCAICISIVRISSSGASAWHAIDRIRNPPSCIRR